MRTYLLLPLLLIGKSVLAAPKPAVPSRGNDSGKWPQLRLQGDHIYQFRELVTSNGGKWLASNQFSGEPIQLWDGKNGLLFNTWPRSSGDGPLLFTPDATRLLVHLPGPDPDAGGGDLGVVAVPTGKVLRRIPIPWGPLWCTNSIVRSFSRGSVNSFDLATGHRLGVRKLEDPPASGLTVAFSLNGEYLVEGSQGIIRWWRESDGKKLGEIKDRLRAIGRTCISNDGRIIASEGDDPKWSLNPDGPQTESAFARNFELHVWETKSKKRLRTLPGYYSLTGGANLLEFSPDGNTLLGAGEGGLDRYIWRTGKNSPVPPPQKDIRKEMNRPISLSNDLEYLGGDSTAFGSSDFGYGLQLWHLAKSAQVAQFASTLRGPRYARWSADGKYLSGGDRLTVWNARTGAVIAENPQTYSTRHNWVDDHTIRSQNLQRIEWYQVPSLKQIRCFDFSKPKGFKPDANQPMDYSSDSSISPDGKFALTADPTNFGPSRELWLWDIATESVLRKIPTPDVDWGYTEIWRIIWLPDNSRVVFGSSAAMYLLNVCNGKVEKQWNDPVDATFRAQGLGIALLPLAVSGDGQWLVARAQRDGTAVVYNSKSLEFVRRLACRCGARGEFLGDGRTVLLSSDQGLEQWDVTAPDDKPKRRLTTEEQGEWNLSPDEKLVVFGSTSVSSNGVSIWNLADGRERVRLYLLGGNDKTSSMDWIALTPAGFYAASPAGERRLRWKDQNGFWPLEKSRARFRNPARVAAALSGRPPK